MVDIYKGFDGNIHPDLFNLYRNNFIKAVDNVIGSDNKLLANKLRLNVSKFAACKTYHATKMLKSIDTADKEIFASAAKTLLKKINNWQATENNTVTARTRTAKQFSEFLKDKDVLTNLKWIRSRSVDPREQHLHLVGVVRPIGDPLWLENQPGNLWNCKCDWVQTTEAATDRPTKTIAPAKGLEGNPAITGEIFSDKHPYFTKASNNKEVEKFIHDNVEYQIKAKFENGGVYYQHAFVDEKASDYKEVDTVASFFAKEGSEVYSLPSIHYKDGFYKKLFLGSYDKKCPDLKINNAFYEVENTITSNIVGLSNMFRRGLKQANRLILDNHNEYPDYYILKNIHKRIREGQNIEEVWELRNNKIKLLYKKQ